MKNKFLIISIILIIISTLVFLQLSQIVVLINSNNNVFVIGAYVLLIVTVLIFFSISIKNIEAKKITETIKIISKTSDDDDEQKDKVKKINRKEEEDARYVKRMVKEITEGISEFKGVDKITEQVLKNLAKTLNIVQGVSFLLDKKTNTFKLSSTYAYYTNDSYKEFKEGEGLTGQVAKNKQFLYIDNVPDNYITILSGLGEGTPKYLTLFPIIFEEKVIGVVEFATFLPLPRDSEKVFEKLKTVIGNIINEF